MPLLLTVSEIPSNRSAFQRNRGELIKLTTRYALSDKPQSLNANKSFSGSVSFAPREYVVF